MPKIDKRIDAYIARSAEFSRPVLTHLRKLVHTACPDVEETIKWGFAFFDYNGPLCNMAAFKQHCAFGFWKAGLITDPKGILQKDGGAGSFGKITGFKDLPSDKIIIGFIKAAMKLNEEGIKPPVKKVIAKKEIPVPDYFKKALLKNKKAATVFEAFSPSHRREYLEWITEAKTEETRMKRLETALEWMAEGKTRLWKYQKK
jgi:uncharacterized protein YdeI (YjbR/CyaY-like superfamily)